MSNETLEQELELEAPGYEPPESAADLGDRDLREKHLRLLLYIGEKATLDIVHVGEDDDPDFLVKRIEETPDHALDLLHNPHRYMPANEARYFFDSSWAT